MRVGFLTALFLGGAVAIAGPAYASVEISAKPTHDMNCSGGVCTPTAKNADLNATDLANMLATGDVKVVTGNGAVTITVTAPFSWTSSHRLTLDANLNVSFKATVQVAGQGAVTIVTNDGGTGGDLIFFDGGKIDFSDLASNLVVNDDHYALVADIGTLAHQIRNKPLGNFAVANDYDASADGTYANSPIENLKGILDGLGHTIANLQIISTGHVNVALVSENQGTIRDISLINEFVSGADTAGLVGDNLGLVTRVTVQGTVQSNSSSAGGVVAHTQGGVISYANAAVNVQGSGDYIGGLVGDASGPIIHCHATGNVTAQSAFDVGGLAGRALDISFSSATGNVSGSGTKDGASIGGLVGDAQSNTIQQSYATGSVTGGQYDYVGGISAGSSTIKDSYSTGSVQGGAQALVGGFSAGGISTGSYSTGFVSVTNTQHRKLLRRQVGGFAVFGLIELERDYWDIDTSGTDIGCAYKHKRCRHVTGLSDVQFKSALPKGFKKSIWRQDPNINNGYPYLIANPPPQ